MEAITTLSRGWRRSHNCSASRSGLPRHTPGMRRSLRRSSGSLPGRSGVGWMSRTGPSSTSPGVVGVPRSRGGPSAVAVESPGLAVALPGRGWVDLRAYPRSDDRPRQTVMSPPSIPRSSAAISRRCHSSSARRASRTCDSDGGGAAGSEGSRRCVRRLVRPCIAARSRSPARSLHVRAMHRARVTSRVPAGSQTGRCKPPARG